MTYRDTECPSASPTGRLPRTFVALRLIAIPLAMLALTGCRDGRSLSDHMALSLNDPEQRHAISFERQRETLIVEAPSDRRRLSRAQEADIYRFLRHYKAEGDSRLLISAPQSARGHLAVKTTLRAVDKLIDDAGIARSAIATQRHRADRHGWPSVRLTYRRPVAVPPHCGDWSEDIGVNRERLNHPNHGCATQRNLAVTVDNARDLIRPRDTDPRSSERRSVTWNEYLAAEKPGSAASQQPVSTTKK